MAHKPQSYYIGTTKKGTNFIALYENVEPSAGEQKMIDRFISQGYEVRFEEKKASPKVEDMRAALAGDAVALAKFEAIYKGDEEVFKKDGSKQTAFFAACAFFNDWKKKNKKK